MSVYSKEFNDVCELMASLAHTAEQHMGEQTTAVVIYTKWCPVSEGKSNYDTVEFQTHGRVVHRVKVGKVNKGQ